MRKMLLSLAAAGVALAAASPAAAQYYPRPPVPAPGYGYNNGFQGEARELHERIDRIEQQIGWLESNGRLGDWRANGLRREAQGLERRLGWEARNGLNPYEARDLRMRIERLEQQVRYSAGGRGDRDDHRWGNGDDRHDHD